MPVYQWRQVAINNLAVMKVSNRELVFGFELFPSSCDRATSRPLPGPGLDIFHVQTIPLVPFTSLELSCAEEKGCEDA